jgi:hypothetical protein
MTTKSKAADALAKYQEARANWTSVVIWDWDDIAEQWVFLRRVPVRTTYGQQCVIRGNQFWQTVEKGYPLDYSCGCACNWGQWCGYWGTGPVYSCGHDGCGYAYEDRGRRA